MEITRPDKNKVKSKKALKQTKQYGNRESIEAKIQENEGFEID